MKRGSLFVIGLVASTIVGGAAIAHGSWGNGGGGGPMAGQGMMSNQPGGMGMMGGNGPAGGMGDMDDMMRMMMQMHGQMGPGGMMGGAGPGDMMGQIGPGMMGGAFEAFDADGNGTVNPEELRTGLAAQLKQYDADGDGSLSIAEFETLHSAMIRNAMVDRFQALDENGDGKITEDEMAAPANRMERMQMMRSQIQTPGAPGAQMPMGQGAGNGTMMNSN